MITEKQREKPILFSGEMVKAILAGSKTQTRRVVKPQPPDYINELHGRELSKRAPYRLEDCEGRDCGVGFQDDDDVFYKCPYGQTGDRLWVRESFCELRRDHWHDSGPKDLLVTRYGPPRRNSIAYKADCDRNGDSERCRLELGYKWKPSIHMPRWASRLQLEVTEVRVERLQDISVAGIQAEGCPYRYSGLSPEDAPDFVGYWHGRWNDINGGKYPWESNPWVWVIEFTPTRPTEPPHEQ